MPIFLISIVVLTVSIQPATDITADDLDMNNIKDIKDKKKRFFDFMRPIIIDENAKVLTLRKKLLDARNNKNNPGLVSKIAEDYSIEWTADNKNWKKLLERVDAITLELALAQSTAKSGWGQSRFAKQGNNFFGQWCYTKGCGIIPSERNRGLTHEVAKFNSVNDSVRSYIKTINTGRVYARLRNIRRDNRAAGKQPDAKAQAGGLIKYSQRRKEYVKEIRTMIQVNKKLMMGQ
ncbi:MAG: glucosaminidase domain-containing protein [Gammaproteobacteria bacterium]